MSEDPIQDGLNWYTYCENNPIRFVDPSGHSSIAGELDNYGLSPEMMKTIEAIKGGILGASSVGGIILVVCAGGVVTIAGYADSFTYWAKVDKYGYTIGIAYSLEDLAKFDAQLYDGGSGGTADPGGSNKKGSGNVKYSRYTPDGWKKTYKTKSLKEIASEKGWKLGDQTMNSSNERKISILDAKEKNWRGSSWS